MVLINCAMRYRQSSVSDWWMLHSLAPLQLMPRPSIVGANSDIVNAKVMALENIFSAKSEAICSNYLR